MTSWHSGRIRGAARRLPVLIVVCRRRSERIVIAGQPEVMYSQTSTAKCEATTTEKTPFGAGLGNEPKTLVESLILAQDQRWRRA